MPTLKALLYQLFYRFVSLLFFFNLSVNYKSKLNKDILFFYHSCSLAEKVLYNTRDKKNVLMKEQIFMFCWCCHERKYVEKERWSKENLCSVLTSGNIRSGSTSQTFKSSPPATTSSLCGFLRITLPHTLFTRDERQDYISEISWESFTGEI